LSYEHKSVAVTVATQLEELNCQSPNCGDLLKVLSFFYPESIPLYMVAKGAEDLQLRFISDSQDLNPWQSLLHKLTLKGHWTTDGPH